EIEQMITIPAEEAFASLKGLKNIESVSRDSISLITIELKWGTDIDMALVQCREIIDSLYPSMPSGAEKSEVFEGSIKKDTIKIAVIPLDNDLSNAENICRTEIKPILQRLEGVSSVKLTGGQEEQIEVLVNKDELSARNLTLQEVSEIIAGSNFEYPAGNIKEGENEFLVKTNGLYRDIKEILQTPLQYNNGGILNISSIAKVRRSHKKQDSFFMLDGKECILLGIQKRNDASPIKVSKTVRTEINELNENFGSYLTFKIIEDQSEYLISSLKQICISAILSFAVAMITVYLFLNSLRLSLMISLIIPLCSIFSIIVLKITGSNLNIMSLSGIAIGIGMVIDCSAVALENIQGKNIEKQKEKENLVITAVNEISSSNTGSCITTIIVFLPVFFMHGLSKELFTSMAIAITASIISSWLLSFTLIPALYMLLSRKNIPVTKNSAFFITAQIKYQKALSFFFKKKNILLFSSMFCLITGALALKTRKFSLLPKLSSDSIEAEIVFPGSTSMPSLKNEAVFLFKSLSEINKDFAMIKSISITGGIEEDDYSSLSRPETVKEHLNILIKLNTKNSSKACILIGNYFDANNIKASVTESNDLLSEILTVGEKSFLYSVPDREKLDITSATEGAAETNISGTDYTIIPDESSKEFVFTPDRISSSRFSITAAYTASIIRSAIEGIESCSYYENGRAIPITVKFKEGQIKNITDLENLNVKLEQTAVPMHILGRFSIQNKEKVLYRNNRKYAKLIQISNEDNAKKLLQTPGFLEKKLADLQKLQIKELWGDSTLLLCVVFVLLYLVLGAQFESFTIPVLMLLALPPALSGALIFLTFFAKNLDINTVIAMVVLFGTVVNNSIILYEKCTSDISKDSARYGISDIVTSCTSRLKALLLTNGTTICSLIPFAFDFKNTSSQSSVAVTIIGGMLFSLAITVFLIPVLLKPILLEHRKVSCGEIK
ncbi:MAG: efflux RND transporter permease subunit, partial [Treponema sp.]|nr:efflux RND transporter permease subunit [Treponema sp.]